jgi:ribosomal subunit interface protein
VEVSALEITISSRHLELSDLLVTMTRKKLERLGRLNHGFTHAEVHFAEERNPRIADRQVCEVLMEGSGNRIRCKTSASDSYGAIDRAATKLEQQLAKLKTRSTHRVHARV